MTVPNHVKITVIAVVAAVVSAGCGAGGDTPGLSRSGAASSSSRELTSNVQDMRDLYALKRQVAALRREAAAVWVPGCGGR